METFKLIPPQDPRVQTLVAPFSDDMLKDTDIKDRKELSDKMFKTMNKYSGLGLSANQCGLPFRMFVMGDNLLLENRRKITAFNPKIIPKLATDLRYKEQILMKEGCLTFPFLFLKIANLQISPTTGSVDYGTDLVIDVSTNNGEDSQGYAATVRDTDIGVLTNTTASPNENGVGVFTVRTGANAGGKAGQTIVDITGINSGARKEFTLTVSASGAAA